MARSREGHFVRLLGRRDVLALAFGAIIGWSWVLLSGQWLQTAGTFGAMAAFTLGGLAMMFIGLTYAELVSAMPRVGGEHAYSLRALGYGASFICTWALILAYVTVVAFESVALSTALKYLWPELEAGRIWQVAGEGVYLSWTLISMAAAIIMTAINVIGVKPAAVVTVNPAAIVTFPGDRLIVAVLKMVLSPVVILTIPLVEICPIPSMVLPAPLSVIPAVPV